MLQTREILLSPDGLLGRSKPGVGTGVISLRNSHRTLPRTSSPDRTHGFWITTPLPARGCSGPEFLVEFSYWPVSCRLDIDARGATILLAFQLCSVLPQCVRLCWMLPRTTLCEYQIF